MGSLFGDKDLAFQDGIAREVNKQFGTVVTYYVLEHAAVPKDPLYGEPIEELHRTAVAGTIGLCVNAFLEYPESSYRTGEEGQRVEYDAQLWMSRKDFEEAFSEICAGRESAPCYRDPRIGDIVECQGRFYDLQKIDLEGQVNDTIGKHTMWLLKLKHRTTFDPRRRLEGEV